MIQHENESMDQQADVQLTSTVGLLVAKSHILLTEPPCFLMSLKGNDDPILIQVGAPYHDSWSTSLEINHTYKFSGMSTSTVTFHDPEEVVHLWSTSQTSDYVECEVDMVSLRSNAWIQKNKTLINYQGIVTSSISPLGTIVLDDKLSLCLFFLSSHMSLEELEIGQEIQVFNAHLTSKRRPTLVTCCRSSVTIVKGSSRRAQLHLPLANVVEPSLGYSGFCRLEEKLKALEEKLCDGITHFLQTNVSVGDSVKHHHILSTALSKLLGLPSCSIDAPYFHTQLLRDFLSVNHPCVLYKQPELPRKNCSFELLNKRFESFDVSFTQPESSVPTYWKWSTMVADGDSLVGVLHVSPSDGQWCLSDSSLSVPCLSDQRLPAGLHGQLVSVTPRLVATERFAAIAGNAHECVKVYLFLSQDAITTLVQITEPPPLLESAMPPATAGGQYCLLCTMASRHIQNEWVGGSCMAEDARGGHEHVAVVHYVATPAVGAGGTAHCFVLVSVLQADHHADAGAFPCVLALEGRAMVAAPLLVPGEAYRLQLPAGFCVKTVAHTRLNCALPWSVAQLPHETSFSRHECARRGTWWPLRDRAASGLFNTEGIVLSRREFPPKFASEAVDPGVSGYGEPNLNVINVVVRDEDLSHSIYLTHWNKRRYPLGLVPGAHVYITLLKPATSTNHNQYFQTTDLSAVCVWSLPSPRDAPGTGAWGRPCDLTLSVRRVGLCSEVCGPVASWTVLSAALPPVCGGCGGPCSYGTCQDPTCLSGGERVVCAPRARVCVRGLGGRAVVHLKGDNVREMLQLEPLEWEVLLGLAKRHDFSYRWSAEPGERTFCSDAENLFQLYCMNPSLKSRCVYLRCKGFKKVAKDSEDDNLMGSRKFPQLYCLEFKDTSPYENDLRGAQSTKNLLS